MLDVKPQEERERGQGLVEYALLLIFVAVVMVALLTVLGPGIANVYENLVSIL
jgi:pilus assembly protein Flp/PilA